jgi:hypothetical protein
LTDFSESDTNWSSSCRLFGEPMPRTKIQKSYGSGEGGGSGAGTGSGSGGDSETKASNGKKEGDKPVWVGHVLAYTRQA